MVKLSVKKSLLDKAIGYFSPGALNRRMGAKLKMSHMEQVGYVIPGSARKTMKGVVASPNSPDMDTAPKLKGSRALSRDMAMNSPIAVAALKRARTNVVGSGLVPQPILDIDFLGITEDQAVVWEAQIQREFITWADSHNADFTRSQNFWDMQAQAFMSTFLNGDMFYMLPHKKPARSGNWPYKLRVKLIEADLVRNPPEEGEFFTSLISGKNIVSGIRLSKNNEVKSAFFANHYPWEFRVNSDRFKRKFTEIELFDRNGRQNWHHLFEPERINQRRGMPYLAPVLDMLKMVTRLSDAALMQALVSSLFTVFITDSSGVGATLNECHTPAEVVSGGGTTQDSEGNQVQQAKDADSYLDLELGSGLIHYLDDDKKIEIADSKNPNDAFAPFMESLVTQLAAALEQSPEQLMIKFSTSYTAARAALLEAWKFWKRKRTWLVREFCQPIYREFVTEVVIQGRMNAPGFFDDPTIKDAWTNCMWAGPGQGQIDPLKEARASLLKIGGNLSTYQEEYTGDKGGIWSPAMAQRSREKKRLDKLGLESNLKPKELLGPDGVNNEEPEPAAAPGSDGEK